MALALSACGGGSSGGSSSPITVTPTPTPTPTPTAGCSLRTRQDWVLAQFNEWYLFPDTMSYVPPSAFSNLSDYVDALTAGARAQGKDRYFSYVTSIAQENAYYASGSTGGFGMRLYVDDAARRLWVSEAFENAPALNAGIDRGAEILSIGPSSANMRTVSAILAGEGQYGLYLALGADTPNVTRVLQIRDGAGTRNVTVTKADFNIDAVSPRYGVKVLTDSGRKVGYVNLRTFISPAVPALRTAFAGFKAQGIDEVIIDLRYNGGGAISVAQVLASLLGGARHSSDIFATLKFRPEKSVENTPYYFQSEADAIAPRRIAFLGTRSTASASELVINGMRPYLRTDIALIGDNTYGKPVGQIALDITSNASLAAQGCSDDRLRLIAFATVNADGDGGYYTGLGTVMEQTCRARDDLQYPLGDIGDDMVARAVDFLDRRTCTPISGSGVGQFGIVSADRSVPIESALEPLAADKPSAAQRDLPGLF
ncbi:MAG: peptidase S41 [Sphingobium sp.]|nr:peptidase S41 [Sphingobium sp.]